MKKTIFIIFLTSFFSISAQNASGGGFAGYKLANNETIKKQNVTENNWWDNFCNWIKDTLVSNEPESLENKSQKSDNQRPKATDL